LWLVWDLLLQALADSGGALDILQMIDSTRIRAQRCAVGEKRGFKARPLAVRAAGSRATLATRSASPSIIATLASRYIPAIGARLLLVVSRHRMSLSRAGSTS
jgi:hypothetical protein